MRTEQELHSALRHWEASYRGCMQAVEMTGSIENQSHAEERERNRKEARVKAALCSRVVDAFRWMLGMPSEFAEQLRKMDEIDKLSNAHRKAGSN